MAVLRYNNRKENNHYFMLRLAQMYELGPDKASLGNMGILGIGNSWQNKQPYCDAKLKNEMIA
jgi:hypothetical protein